jgi:hypothetical protein
VDNSNFATGSVTESCLGWAVTAIPNQLNMSDDCASDPQDPFQQAFF